MTILSKNNFAESDLSFSAKAGENTENISALDKIASSLGGTASHEQHETLEIN